MGARTAFRPDVQDLSFQVYDRPLHPEFFQSLLTESFRREGWQVRVHLTPAGHLWEWRMGKLCLVETLADQTRPLPDQRQLFAHRVAGERTESFSPTSQVSYQTCFQLEVLPEEYFFHFHDELESDAAKTGLLHRLRPHDRLGLSPVSYLDIQARPRSLILHVYHTYPEEYAVVKSQTLIEFNGG